MLFIANGADFSIVALIRFLWWWHCFTWDYKYQSQNGPGHYHGNHLSNFSTLGVYPNFNYYIASITDANNYVSTDTLHTLDVLCSNETLVDFEPLLLKMKHKLYFQMFRSMITFIWRLRNASTFKPDCIDISEIMYKKVKITE